LFSKLFTTLSEYRTTEGSSSYQKKEDVPLPSNEQNAKNRFKSLEKKLSKNANLRHVYYTHTLDYVRGQVEVVDPGKEEEGTFYLPHHAVSKGKREDTKWRIIFDASSYEKGSPSLNDTLEMEPKLLPEIFATLLRFRLNPVAIVGDIHKLSCSYSWKKTIGISQHSSGTA
jgi:hypothetical protein